MKQRKIVKQERGFKGVWIPKEIWLSEDLKSMELLVLTEIQSLDNEKGCTASNSYLADFFGVTPQRISQIISILKDKGYIKITYQKEGKWCKGRCIKVSNKFYTGYKENLQGYQINLQGYKENFKANNTNNNTSINTDKDILSSCSIPYQEIVEYLNKRTGKKFKYKSKATQRLIKARWNEGFELDDFKKVVDNKCLDWLKDEKMSEYLRPATLFGTKFESYLNQKTKQPKQQKEKEWLF